MKEKLEINKKVNSKYYQIILMIQQQNNVYQKYQKYYKLDKQKQD